MNGYTLVNLIDLIRGNYSVDTKSEGRKEGELVQINLDPFDMKKIKQIAVMEGKNPEALSENDILDIISHALVLYKVELVELKVRKKSLD
ncbi:hypothetical protein PAJ34TS1_45200 [Paenibacillus azoreducens]